MKGMKSAIVAGLLGAGLWVMPATAGSTVAINTSATGTSVPVSVADPMDMQGRRGAGFGGGAHARDLRRDRVRVRSHARIAGAGLRQRPLKETGHG